MRTVGDEEDMDISLLKDNVSKRWRNSESCQAINNVSEPGNQAGRRREPTLSTFTLLTPLLSLKQALVIAESKEQQKWGCGEGRVKLLLVEFRQENVQPLQFLE